MFIMLDIRKTGLTGEEFAWRLLDEESVGTMPGESFGSGGAGHVRVALTVESELLKEASIRIRRLADTCLSERK
jgi:arginine:pyruvate transaminase